MGSEAGKSEGEIQKEHERTIGRPKQRLPKHQVLPAFKRPTMAQQQL